MAEGWLRHLAGDRFEYLSAGVAPAGFVHRIAIQVMQEVGIDISRCRSKSIREFLPPAEIVPDVIISVCDKAANRCPVFPEHVERWLWPFDDPYYSECEGEELVSEFRRVRNEIRAAIEEELANGTLS